MAAQDAASECAKVACANGFDQAEEDAPDHCARKIANAAEHGRCESFEARQEAHAVVYCAVIGRPHHASDSSQHSANDEGGGDHGIGLNTHECGHSGVLRRGTHGAPQICFAHHIAQDSQAQGCDAKNEDLSHGDDRATHVDRVAADQVGVGLEGWLKNDLCNGLQQDAHTDSCDQRRKAWAGTQRSVSQLFNRVVERRADDTGNHEREQ